MKMDTYSKLKTKFSMHFLFVWKYFQAYKVGEVLGNREPVKRSTANSIAFKNHTFVFGSHL